MNLASGSIISVTDSGSLGSGEHKWKTVYATTLNNGADLALPTEGGTLARLEDIPEDLQTVELVDSSVELDINTIYNAGEMASLSITFPTVDVRYTSQLNFTSGTTATAFTAPDDIKWDGDSIVEGAFVPEINKRYVILFYYDGVNICAIARG